MKIANLVTDSGVVLKLSDRLVAMIEEIYKRRNWIEACQAGQIEIIIDFKDSSIRVSQREITEPRRIE